VDLRQGCVARIIDAMRELHRIVVRRIGPLAALPRQIQHKTTGLANRRALGHLSRRYLTVRIGDKKAIPIQRLAPMLGGNTDYRLTI
jgi:hypothetical protein